MGLPGIIKIEKGMYQEKDKSFTQVLESIDPSEQYYGTNMEGLDAFQRQLKRFDIKVKGDKSDTVEKFFATQDSSVLFPEFVARMVRRGIEDEESFRNVVASSTTFKSVEEAEIKRAKLCKYGRLLNMSYDAIRAQKLDLFSVVLRHIGFRIARSQWEAAIDLLINGDEYNAPAKMTLLKGAGISYDTVVEFWDQFHPYEMNAVIASNDVALMLLKMPEFRNPITGATVIRDNVLSRNTAIGIDNRFALEMIRVGDVVVEHEKLINRQFEQAAITTIVGFSKIFEDASRVLSISNCFP